MAANPHALMHDEEGEDGEDGDLSLEADGHDEGDNAEEHGRMLKSLRQTLLGKKSGGERAPPAAAMDVHGLRTASAGPSGGVSKGKKRDQGGGASLQQVLATALGGSAAKRVVGEELRSAKRKHRVLEAPIKHLEAKSQRIAAYERANKDLGRWYGYVERNRLAEEVAFPLPPTDAPRPQSAADYRQRARADIAVAAAAPAAASTTPEDGGGGDPAKAPGNAPDDLESRLYRRLYSEAAISQAAGGGVSSAAASAQQQLLDGVKVRERLASNRRLVARRHFLEEKLKRQARIKSKSYRRHARRARLKQEVAELTALKDTDPAAFAERMAALERARADERISQRHRSGGKFARQQKLRARFDDAARQAVQEMIQRGKDLTEKTAGDGDEDGDDEDNDSDAEVAEAEADEAMMSQLPADLVDEWNDAAVGADEITAADEALPASLRPAVVAGSASQLVSQTADSATSTAKQKPQQQQQKPSLDLDLSHLPALATADDDEGNDAVEAAASAGRRLARLRTDELLLTEAAEDDAEGQATRREEFEQERAAVADEEQPQDVDLFLAGWNSWTGPGTRPASEAHRQRFVIKAPRLKRRDAATGNHVIIREKRDSSQALRRHLVKDVPFPYANAEQFEAAMRAPVCRDFNSIQAHKRLTAPRVTVHMGRAIAPVAKDAILRRKRTQRTNRDIARGKK